MPRTARASNGGMWYLALNRGNSREAVFHELDDYDDFVDAIIDVYARIPVDLLTGRTGTKRIEFGGLRST
jgi:putative transposase